MIPRIFSFILILFSFGCQPQLQKTKTPPETLVVGIEAAPLTLDPRLASDAYSSKLSRLIHNGLFRLSERLEVVPDLAERFENPVPRLYRIQCIRISKALFHSRESPFSRTEINQKPNRHVF